MWMHTENATKSTQNVLATKETQSHTFKRGQQYGQYENSLKLKVLKSHERPKDSLMLELFRF